MNYLQAIQQYRCYNPQEKADKQLMLQLCHQYNNLLTRENPVAHFTASSLIVNPAMDKTVMVYHNIYRSWSWTGGHADGESDLLQTALREAKEETGLTNIVPYSGDVYSLDILPLWGHVKWGQYVSSHLHLNLTYLLLASEEEPLQVKPDENSGVKWFDIDQMVRASTERDMIPVYQKLIDKLPLKGQQ